MEDSRLQGDAESTASKIVDIVDDLIIEIEVKENEISDLKNEINILNIEIEKLQEQIKKMEE